MGSTRQRSDRPDSARRRQFHTPEQLESRLVLSAALPSFLSLYTPSDLYVTNPITNQRIPISARDLMQHNNPNSSILSNQGKIVSGTDRAGDQWTITVHGPGQVIVTDTTPNDGALDDDIATIQIINSSLRIDIRDRNRDRLAASLDLRPGALRSPDRKQRGAIDRAQRLQPVGQRDAGGRSNPGNLPLRRSANAQVQRHRRHH